jgi:hypothetical protein
MGGNELFTLPVAALQLDSVILDNQEDHVVMTLRVPKAVIRSNMQLLMGLADRSLGRNSDILATPMPDPPVCRVPAAGTRKTPHWQYAALILAAVIAPSPFFTNSFASYPPPVTVESVKAAKPAFEVGEPIDIVFRYRRDRACQTTYDELIQNDSTGEPAYNRRIYGATDAAADGEMKDFHLILRATLAPGSYTYIGSAHRQCALGGVYDTSYPKVPLMIVVRQPLIDP